jgi:hypothetical protein
MFLRRGDCVCHNYKGNNELVKRIVFGNVLSNLYKIEYEENKDPY